MANQDLAKVATVSNALKTNYVLIEVNGSIRRISIANFLNALGLSAFASIPTTDNIPYAVYNGQLTPLCEKDGYIFCGDDSLMSSADTLELEGKDAPLVPVSNFSGMDEKE